jgi:hypothetical protein
MISRHSHQFDLRDMPGLVNGSKLTPKLASQTAATLGEGLQTHHLCCTYILEPDLQDNDATKARGFS